MTQALDDKHGGPLAHYESAAATVEGATSLRRIIVMGEHPHAVKAGGEQRVNPFGAACQGDVGLAVFDRTDRGQDIDQSARAGSGMADSRSAQSKTIGHSRAAGVRHPLLPPGHRHGIDVLRPKLLDDKTGIPHVATDGARETIQVELVKIDPSVFESLGRGNMLQRDGLRARRAGATGRRQWRRSKDRRGCPGCRARFAHRFVRVGPCATRFRGLGQRTRSYRCQL